MTERIATEIFDAIHQNVATKADVELLKTELKADIERLKTELKADIERLKTELKADIERLKTELKLDVEWLRTDLQLLKAELPLLEHRLMMRLGSLVLGVAGLLFVALRYLPPVH
jgi:hypothetical protein